MHNSPIHELPDVVPSDIGIPNIKMITRVACAAVLNLVKASCEWELNDQ